MLLDNKLPGISIKAVGDILLADAYFDIGYGVGSQIKRGAIYSPFLNISDYLKDADIVIGNLECCISNSTSKTGLRAKEFLASPLVIPALVKAGFNVLLVANNHILQHGTKAYRDTINYLIKAGINPIGYIPEGESLQTLTKVIVKGKTVGFLGYSMAEDEHNAVIKEYAFCRHIDVVLNDIKQNKDDCDFIIILFHWGDEFVSFPSREQIEMAHQCIDEGADAIIGGHSHVLQGVETYNKKNLVYSLGNFVFNMPAPICRYSAILSLVIDEDDSQKVNLQPVWINKYGLPEVPNGKMHSDIEKIINANSANIYKGCSDSNDYKAVIKNGLSNHRKWQKIQFITNLYRMDKRWILQMLYEYIKRRVDESYL